MNECTHIRSPKGNGLTAQPPFHRPDQHLRRRDRSQALTTAAGEADRVAGAEAHLHRHIAEIRPFAVVGGR